MTSLITSARKSEYHVFIMFKLMPGVSTSMTLFFQESAMILSSSITFIMILLTSVDLIVSVADNLYSDKGLNVITKLLKFMFQYSLFNSAQFSEELKLLNDYFEDYETDTDFDKNALNQDFRNNQDKD